MKELVAAIIVRDKRLLLVHNVKHGTLRIEPPGGKIHAGETREAAVAREAMEELGIEVRVKGLFCKHPTDSPEGGFIVQMFVCEITGGEPRVVEPDKIPAFGWYTVEEMERMRGDGTLVPNMGGALEEIGRMVEGEE
ncbi:MAG: NUDIX hydrolase [Deltaproteobacteria bacterium]